MVWDWRSLQIDIGMSTRFFVGENPRVEISARPTFIYFSACTVFTLIASMDTFLSR